MIEKILLIVCSSLIGAFVGVVVMAIIYVNNHDEY